MSDFFQRLEGSLLQNTYWEWSAAGAASLLVVAAIFVLRGVARRQHRRLALTNQVELAEVPLLVISKTATAFVWIVGLVAGLSMLDLPKKVDRVTTSVFTIGLFVQLGVWATTALVAWLEHRRRSALETDRAAVGSLGIIGVVLRVLVWALVLLLTLDNLGIDVTALVAGLGVGGIAVALAVQNILGDLFASLSITLDKPFVVGDFLIIGDFMGSVEHIGIKSVRLRSLSGEQIVVGNTDLLQSRVRNYGRMVERRIVFSLGVTYETSRAKLREIPALIRGIVEREEETRFDRSHFSGYGDFSLNFETVYYVLSADFTRYMDIQQRIYFAIHEAFESRAIEFAYPTRKLWLASVPETSGRESETSAVSSQNGRVAVRPFMDGTREPLPQSGGSTE